MLLQLLAFWFLFDFHCYLLRGDFSLLYEKVRRYPRSYRPWTPEFVDRVCTSMSMVCVWYPSRVLCLQRSAATTCLLRRFGVPAQMTVGSQLFPFRLHAWVELNGRIVNDKPDVPEMYNVLDRF